MSVIRVCPKTQKPPEKTEKPKNQQKKQKTKNIFFCVSKLVVNDASAYLRATSLGDKI
jgi:hypothetical protein